MKNNMKLPLAIIIALLFSFASNAQNVYDDFEYDGAIEGDPDEYSLVWADEFNTDGAIDLDKWFHQTKLPSGGSWFNNEIQHYTDRTDNAVVEDGILKIIAKKETYTDQGYTKNYTSARLNSKFAFTYGKVEVKAKLPTGVGTWPAIWMLGKNINENGAYWETQGYGTTTWPDCGEIDIMEHWGSNQNYVQSATHTPSSYGATENHGGQTISTASTEFHVYSLEWILDKLIFAVDGNIHYVYEPQVQNADTWPFDADQYLLLNIAIQPNIEDSFTESAMEIDYVRVYQRDDLSINNMEPDRGLQVYPNPVNDQLKLIFDDIREGETALVKIYTMSGQLVTAKEITTESNQITLNGLGALPKGVYSGTVSIQNNYYSFKMVK
ncbi:MAG: family 16 glycosylhydrolase [Bacteroidales bacterium]|nr:family 16 glycosylhydrolase [Bacteroidales bacterium]